MAIPKTRRGTAASNGNSASAASRTYHSTPAAPQQVHFPARQTVVKTYSSRRKTASASRVSALRQSTLTQAGYVTQSEGHDDPYLLIDDDDQEQPTPSHKPGTERERPQKRRKTIGDTPNSSFHTQTLTQLLGERGEGSKEEEEGEDMLRIKDSDDNDNEVGWDAKEEEEEEEEEIRLPELPKEPEPERSSAKRKQRTQEAKREEENSKKTRAIPPAIAAPPLPHTPSSKRIKVDLDEVPSSQPTPFTPMLERYSPPNVNRSPLKERSTNVNAPTPTLSEKRPRNLVIQDSYSPGSSARFSSSIAAAEEEESPLKETPTNRRRKPLAELPLGSSDLGQGDGYGDDDGGESVGDETPTRARTRTGSARRVHMEIPDSDDELESVGGPSPLKRRSQRQQQQQQESQVEETVVVTADMVLDGVSNPPETPRPPRVARDSREDEIDDEVFKPPHGTPVVYEDSTGSISLGGLSHPPETPQPQRTENVKDDTGDQPNEPPHAETPVIYEDSTAGTPLRSASKTVETPQPRRFTEAAGGQGDGANEPTPQTETPVIYEDSTAGTPLRSASKPLETPQPRRAGAVEEAAGAESAGPPSQPKTPVIDEAADDATTASESEDALEPGTPTPVVRRVQIQLPPSSAPEEEILKETPRKGLPGRTISPKKHSPMFQRHTQARSQRYAQAKSQRHTQGRSQRYTQVYSQGLESQRVPLEVISNMGPQTDRSDIIISIHPEPLKEIVEGLKDHEFRSYKFPPQVSRCWIYTTRPVGEVRYMAELGPAKEPGEINSQSGLGNAEFNSGELGNNCKYAHELLQVYQLNNPVKLDRMKEYGLGDGPPQKYKYVPPAIVGQLLTNLRCALFAEPHELEELEEEDEDEDKEGGNAVAVTISQELEEQLRSDIVSSTQMAPPTSSQGLGHGEVIPASQDETPATTVSARSSPPIVLTAPRKTPTLPSATTAGTLHQPPRTGRRQKDDTFTRPALPRPASPPPPQSRFTPRVTRQSQRRSPRQLQRVPSYGNNNMVRPSQATTASNLSSPPNSPQKTLLLSSVPRPSTSSVPEILREFEEGVGETGSSPLLLRESLGEEGRLMMMMQDSLLVDEVGVRAPPTLIDWSDEE